MGAATLKRVSNAKYLGLTIDDKLNWNCHVTELCKNISKVCNIMYKLRHFLPLPSRISVYYSLFYSRVTYGVLCWGVASHNVLNPIRVLQNKVIKAMLFKPFFFRIKTLLVQSNLLCIKDIVNLETAKHVHKFNTKSLPTVFTEQYTTVSTIHDHFTRASARNDLVISRTLKDIGARATKVRGAAVWNAVPAYMRTLSLKQFKIEYKKWMITKYST